MGRTAGTAVCLAAVAVVALVGGYGLGAVELPGEDVHDEAVVTLHDADGARLATVEARVADTRKERIRGLSDAESLPNGSGMLFVHDGVDERTYVMREMAFPLDIVFVVPCEDCPAGTDGRITVVHEAPVPPEGERSPPYRGRAKWVLEVPRGYADAVGVEAGDYVTIEFRTDDGERS